MGTPEFSIPSLKILKKANKQKKDIDRIIV